jgi:hypothetical protein
MYKISAVCVKVGQNLRLIWIIYWC